MRDAEKTKTHILNTAQRIFAEKGFDAARVDEIAREAGVNKALIYYYYKNKKSLLDTMLMGFLKEGLGMLRRYEEKILKSDLNHVMESGFLEEFLAYLKEKKEMIKILLMDSLKGNDSVLMNLVKTYQGESAAEMTASLKERGFFVDQNHIHWILGEFFTGLLPFLLFSVYQDQLAETFSVAPETLEKPFMVTLLKAHLATHRE